MSTSDLEKTLEKWHSAKEKLAILEQKIDKYKSTVSKELKKQGTDSLHVGRYNIVRRHNVRTSLSKDSVPTEVWQRYATRSEYDAFFLTKK